MKPNLAPILAITAALGALPLATEGGWAKGGGGGHGGGGHGGADRRIASQVFCKEPGNLLSKPLIDSDLNKPVRILLPEGRARRLIAEIPRAL